MPLIEIVVRPEARSLITGIVRRWCTREDDVEDHIQDVVVKALNVDRLIDPGNWEAYVATITKNHMIDAWRRRTAGGKRHEDILVDNPERKDHIRESSTVVEDFSDTFCTQEVVRQGFSQLKRPLQQVLYLKYFKGMEQSEIGQTLGIPVGTVKSRLWYATRELHNTVAES